MGVFRSAEESAEERFDRLFRNYFGRVLAYALRRASAEVANDVAADTFLVAWRRLDQLPREPLPWLLGIARKTLANQRRGERRRHALIGELRRQELAGRVAESGELRLTLDEIASALARLPEADRELLELISWDGLDIGEAAVVLGISSATARVRLYRARRRLRLKLEARAEDDAPGDDSFPAIAEGLK